MRNLRNFGFSLIELLIVIAILAITMGFLFPIFKSAKQRVGTIKCASNLRQVVMAWQMYADNNDGKACPASTYIKGKNTYDEYLWDKSLTDVSKKEGKGYLSFYMKDGRITSCPEFTNLNLPIKSKYACKGYGYNTTYIGGGDFEGYRGAYQEPCNVNTIQHPTKTAVFSDVISFNYGEKGNENIQKMAGSRHLRSPDEGKLVQEKLRSTNFYPNGAVHFRHQGCANVAFADGHVSSVQNRDYFKLSTDIGALPPESAQYNID